MVSTDIVILKHLAIGDNESTNSESFQETDVLSMCILRCVAQCDL